MSSQNADNIKDLKKEREEAFDFALDIGTRLIGAKAGLVVAGPVGAYVGSIVAPTLKRGAEQIRKRFLPTIEERQDRRAMEGLGFALLQIQTRLESGEQFRQDDFFEQADDRASSAEELLEGVVLRCRDEFREKKCKYIAKILGNGCFTNLSADTLHYVLEFARQLTYRQICLLQIFSNAESWNLRRGDYDKENVGEETLVILREAYALYTPLELIECQPGQNYPYGLNVKKPKSIMPGCMKLRTWGKTVSELMGLDELPLEDLESVAKFLRKDVS